MRVTKLRAVSLYIEQAKDQPEDPTPELLWCIRQAQQLLNEIIIDMVKTHDPVSRSTNNAE